ncbi:MAG TPA: exodeoxyribonuclease VII large subunit [Candidatus Acidoferrales bacterium]|jgi:exodeoxyribonuclease VII large subunit|nr:exodeoxyribonuclease VII large subunit [Candidatus Acidoferrales bacterium]
MTKPFQLPLMPRRTIWSVSDLTGRIRDLLAGEFTDVFVEGEVSNAHAAQSGHLYFTLKDNHAQIRCVCFRTQLARLKFRPEDGLHVTVRGSISVYEARGEYQFYVEHVEPVGLGALQLAFEQLKKRLDAEGLFDPERKKPLPVLPQCVGLITSPSGAAVRDIVHILERRFPNLHIVLYPVRVQGEGAAGEIVQAIRYFDRKQIADVLILARGGGSPEDLWAFNEETVARAIVACSIPIISGVGHETDFTIADFAADIRASTPSAAAEMVVRTRQEFDSHLCDLRDKVAQLLRYRLLQSSHKLREFDLHRAARHLEDGMRRRRQHTDELASQLADALRRRVEALQQRLQSALSRISAVDFRARVRAAAVRLDQRTAELELRIGRTFTARRQSLEKLIVQLEERSPLRLLERGYAICYDAAGNVVQAADQVALGDRIRVQLARGRLGAEVKDKE